MNLPTLITLAVVAAIVGLAVYFSHHRRGCCESCRDCQCGQCPSENCTHKK